MPLRDVVGHNRLISLLKRSVGAGTVPPSLLFTGPSGVGKRLTAVGVAQALNCLRLPTNDSRFPTDSRLATLDSRPTAIDAFDACGVCAACTRIARGVHPDVVVVEPGDTGTIKIDQVRDVVESTGFRPFEGRRRVVIIDEADALVPPAQNALLKTLEEPPPSSVFVLVTSRPDVLLPTVRSRCPQLRFRPLAADDIAAILIARGQSDARARAVAATAQGSVRQALAASAEELFETRDLAAHVLAQASLQNEAARRIAGAQDLLAKTGAGGAGDREQLASHLRAMASLLRDVEVLATGADERALANPDVRPVLDRLAAAYRGGRGVRAFASVDEALVALERNAGVKIVADWLVLQL